MADEARTTANIDEPSTVPAMPTSRAEQPSLFGPARRSRQAAQPSASADATLERRWRALAATAPIHQLVRNLAYHPDLDADSYDLRQLALAALDATVASMGYGQELTVEGATDHLIGIAQRMQPAPQRSSEHQEIAAAVLANLLNHSGDSRRFSYRYADMAREPLTWRDYSFKLLQLRETEIGDCLVASDQAVMLYVAALDTDLEDAEYAHAVMLRRQLADGRLGAAEVSAAQARRTSEGYAANLSSLLADTTRDVGSHDWQSDVPQRLSRARKHINDRLGDDDKLLDHLRAGLDTDVTPEVRASSGRIIDLLNTGRNMHLTVLSTLVDARSVHVEALTRQRLAARKRLRMLRLSEDLLVPALTLPEAASEQVTAAFGDAASGVTVPRQATLGLMLRMLWATPRLTESPPVVAETPQFQDEVDPQAYPDDVIAAARAHLAPVLRGPVRLSELLEEVHRSALDEDAREAVTELLVLSALWAFDPAVDDDEENTAQVDLLATDLLAVDDGQHLNHRWAVGADLLLTHQSAVPPIPPPSVGDDIGARTDDSPITEPSPVGGNA